MPAPFLESRLEIGIDFGATYGPRFNTAVTRQADGREQRRALWSQPLVIAQLGQRSVTQTQLNYLIAFHASVQGAYSGFRLRDWSDFYAVNQVIGTGNGTSQTWQLVKRYSAGGFTVTRPITKPVADSVVVYLDGVEQASGWSVDGATGVFTTALSGVISASFEFDVPVRFEQDRIEFTFKAAGAVNLFELATVTCTEVRLEPTILPALDPLPGELLETIALGYDLETQGGPEFSTQIAMTGAEFESRAALWTTALGQWNIGARTLNREQIDYFLAWFRVCRGQSVPFSFYDWQSETTKRVRFSEDRISFTFQAYRRHDKEAIFTLGGAALKEVSPSTCTPKTLNFSDPLTSAWTVVSAQNTGIFAGATYNLDTSGGFWRTTLGWGNGISGLSASIIWSVPYSYIPTAANEIIEIEFSAEMRLISSTTESLVFPLSLNANQLSNSDFIVVNCLNFSDWTTVSGATTILFPLTLGTPISFTIGRANSNALGDYSYNTAIVDIKNLSININVTCS